MLNRTILVCAIVSLLLGVLPSVAAADKAQNVMLVGWDGAQRDHVNECLSRKELPNLQRLIDEGTYVEIDIEGKTDTKAGWSQILTGYYPDITGVYTNSLYQPIPKGLSIFERLEKYFGADEFVTVAVIGKRTHCGEINPPRETRVEGRSAPGSPYYNMYTALEVWEFGLIQDKKVGSRALELLEEYKDKPFFFFVHFAEVDAMGYRHGENSKQYNDALISNDFWTGKIMDKVKELGLADKTQVYVTSDHGYNEGERSHSFAPYVFLATNNKDVNRNGRRQDVAPTILEAFGVDLRLFEPPFDGISLTKPDNREPAKIKPWRGLQYVDEPVRKKAPKPDAPFYRTPQNVVDKMLELAKVTKDDLVYDLGCGDGRIVVTAAKRYGCRAVGYEIDRKLVKASLENVQKNNVGHLVRIEQKDIFTLDLSEANVITLYLGAEVTVKLIPQLEKLKPGSRIVSHDFDMRGIKPDRVVQLTTDEDSFVHTIYLWTSPLKKTE